MDKLTLNELKGYLGTGLKIECHSNEEIKIRGSYVSEMVGMHKGGVDDNYGNNWTFDVKPRLYPLSSLTEYREDLGFVPMDKINIGNNFFSNNHGFLNENGETSSILILPYTEIQKLFDWHFDCFNLIDRNLAINIKTLKDE